MLRMKGRSGRALTSCGGMFSYCWWQRMTSLWLLMSESIRCARGVYLAGGSWLHMEEIRRGGSRGFVDEVLAVQHF